MIPCEQKGEKPQSGAALRYLICLPMAIDRHVRIWDFRLNASYGGSFSRIIGDGHSASAFITPLLLLLVIVFGPKPSFDTLVGWVTFSVVIVLLWATFWLADKWNKRYLAILQVALVSATAFIVWSLGSPIQADGGMYQHVLLVLAPALLIPGLIFARILSRQLTRGLARDWGDQYRERLCKTELFVTPTTPNIGWWDLLRALMDAPVRRPLSVAIFPALVVVLQPEFTNLFLAYALAFALSIFVTALADIHSTLDSTWMPVRRLLGFGGPAILTSAIVSLEGSRLAGNDFVTTILDQVSWDTIIPIALSGYVFFWFYEYWTNRFLSEDLLRVLGEETGPGRISYSFEGSERHQAGVPANGRSLQIHGGARVAAVCSIGFEGYKVFQFYERGDLFGRIADTEIEDPSSNVRSRARVYFGLTTATILFLCGVFYYGLLQTPEIPLQTFSESRPGAGDLEALLMGKGRAVAVAASGQGTRGAMHATAVMRGLYETGLSNDLVLLSGVSGGGVSLTYFAQHEEALRNGDDLAWRRYGQVMGHEFINDVLAGVGEWRIARGHGIGHLLHESFQRNFGNHGRPKTLGDLNQGLGLILNSSLAGILDLSDCPLCVSSQDRDTWVEDAQANRHFTMNSTAGSRVVFTNLNPATFRHFGVSTWVEELNMPHVVVSDRRFALTAAAALQANFLPVFPNVPIDDEEQRRRYWVTGGESAENAGLLSLLLALEGSIECWSDGYEENEAPSAGEPACPDEWKTVHVVVSDGSGASTDLTQDSGNNTSLYAAGLANQAIDNLLEDLQSRVNIRLHYLTMPAALNVNGGLGTHWMRQEFVKVADPQADPVRTEATAHVVKASNVYEVLYNLYRGSDTLGPWFEPFGDAIKPNQEDVEVVAEYVCSDKVYPVRWLQLQETVGADLDEPCLKFLERSTVEPGAE